MILKSLLALCIQRSAFNQHNGGVAAAEFGLLVPVFALCLLGMIDVGIAINDKMSLDRYLRSGAQLVMAGIDDISELESAVMNSEETAPEETPPSLDTIDYALSVTRTCECGGTAGSCTDRCTGGEPPSLFYNFNASQTMDTMLLPVFDIVSDLRIQVR